MAVSIRTGDAEQAGVSMAQAAPRGLDTARLPQPPTAVDAEARTWFARAVVAAPESVAAAVAGFSVGPMVLLLLGHFTVPLALPLGLLGALGAVWCCGVPAGPVSRSAVGHCVAALAVAIGWYAYNVRYAAQDVYARRDPATYTITGRWLVDHGSLQIHTNPEIFGSPLGATIATGSYAHVSGDVLNAQGSHLLPALLGLSSSVFGGGALFTTNVGLSALALFVFYGLARRVVAPTLALIAMIALAVSMPVIYVARDTFTEPLTLLFLMGSLALLHRAVTSGRLTDFALAGLVGGSAAMVRIDSYAALIGLVVAALVVARLDFGRPRDGAGRAGALLAGAAMPALLGWLDLATLSRQYFGALHHEITMLTGALVASVLAVPVIARLTRRARLRAWLSQDRIRSRATAAAVAVLVLVFVGLASRPAWLTTRGPRDIDLENMQARWGAAVDGTLTYNEQTVHWLALYFGWPTVILGVVGYGVLLHELLRRRMYELTGFLVMGLAMSALYLWNGQVVPDQPWAMRRYVPVVVPLLLVAAASGLQALWRAPRVRGWARPVAVLAGIYLLSFPARVTWPMRHVREQASQLSQVRALCAAIGPHGAVVEVDDEVIFGYGQTLRSFCGVPTIGLTGATAAQLGSMSAAVMVHGRVLFVLSQHPTGANVEPFSTLRVQTWPNQINVAPKERDFQTTTVYLSTVDTAGQTHAVAPVR